MFPKVQLAEREGFEPSTGGTLAGDPVAVFETGGFSHSPISPWLYVGRGLTTAPQRCVKARRMRRRGRPSKPAPAVARFGPSGWPTQYQHRNPPILLAG